MTALSRKPKVSHNYFLVMCNLGGRLGLEAVVHPEDTRRNIIDRIKSGEYEHIVFIHRFEDGLTDDLTDELVDEAEALLQAAE